MSKKEILTLMSNDSNQQDLVIAIITGFSKLPEKQRKALQETFNNFMQGE